MAGFLQYCACLSHPVSSHYGDGCLVLFPRSGTRFHLFLQPRVTGRLWIYTTQRTQHFQKYDYFNIKELPWRDEGSSLDCAQEGMVIYEASGMQDLEFMHCKFARSPISYIMVMYIEDLRGCW